MPAQSKSQRRLFAMAEHEPEKLFGRNKRLADLPHSTLHEFAATKEKGLPEARMRPEKKKDEDIMPVMRMRK